MIEFKHPDSTLDRPWPDSDQRLRVADTSMLPGSEKAPAPAVDLLNHAVRGAHNSIDRLAESVAPTVQRLGEGVSAAEDALHAKTEQLRVTTDEWVDSLRTTVRSNPLACVAAALALGAVVARITR